MRPGWWRKTLCAGAVCGTFAAAPSATAADPRACITAGEARAFSLRHLQSRLMVAGLACNQREAYNEFVEAFRPPLAEAGAELIGYFQRAGGGQPALNRHVTGLANVAGLRRAADPEGFCRATWNVFLLLKERPAALNEQADAHVLKDAGAPAACGEPAAVAAAQDPAVKPD
jgi:hypothetical protein